MMLFWVGFLIGFGITWMYDWTLEYKGTHEVMSFKDDSLGVHQSFWSMVRSEHDNNALRDFYPFSTELSQSMSRNYQLYLQWFVGEDE